MKKTKPCPFCGGEARTLGQHRWWVACQECTCDIGFEGMDEGGCYGHYDTESEAAEAWNTRANENTRWHKLFGTPERAAQTYIEYLLNGCDEATCGDGCPFFDTSMYMNCALGTDHYDTLLEWLRGES